MGVGYEGLGDDDLVARARAADTAAFAELYRRHRERISTASPTDSVAIRTMPSTCARRPS